MSWIRPSPPLRYRIPKARGLECRTIMARMVAEVLQAKREGNAALLEEYSRLLQPTHSTEDGHAI